MEADGEKQRAKYYRITAAGKKQLSRDLALAADGGCSARQLCNGSRKEATHEAAPDGLVENVLQSRETS